MRIRSKNRKQDLLAEINITPFTDVILVLLIIFMVTTPLIFQSGIKVHLPQSETSDEIPKMITVAINEQGEAVVEDRSYNLRYDLGVLKWKLASLVKDKPNMSVVINGDRNVKYDFVVKVVDLVSQLGAKPVLLGTELKK